MFEGENYDELAKTAPFEREKYKKVAKTNSFEHEKSSNSFVKVIVEGLQRDIQTNFP